MFHFFKNIFGQKKKTTRMSIQMPNPNTDNEYKFYKYIEKSSAHILEGVLNEIRNKKLPIKPQYEKAILQKIETGSFKNPHTQTSYFNNKFDFVGIDFETANYDRVSACALGIAFVKNETIVDEDFYYIKPPKGTKFMKRHVAIHGITEKDIKYAPSFGELWNSLKDIFNNNLIVLHNASMDASILKQLFELYQIEDHNVTYLCTMNLAKHLGYPAKLIELCDKFNIKIEEHHNPQFDAIACVKIASELIPQVTILDEFKVSISTKQPINNQGDNRRTVNNNTFANNPIDRKYLYPKKCIDERTIEYFFRKKIVITGVFEQFPVRNDLAKLLWELGADIDSKVTERTNILALGHEYGYKKFEEAQKNIDNGCDTCILNEEELLKFIPFDVIDK